MLLNNDNCITNGLARLNMQFDHVIVLLAVDCKGQGQCHYLKTISLRSEVSFSF